MRFDPELVRASLGGESLYGMQIYIAPDEIPGGATQILRHFLRQSLLIYCYIHHEILEIVSTLRHDISELK